MFDLPPLTTNLAAILAIALVVRWAITKYPDIHPHSLYFQSSLSPVREPDESQVYRSTLTPFTYPLLAGLNIRESNSFRDGNLQDIWDLGKNGRIGEFDKSLKQIKYFNQDEMEKSIKYLAANFKTYVPEVSRIAIYLPNSIENITASFACAFAAVVNILTPLSLEIDELSEHFAASKPEILVVGAGTLDFTQLIVPSSLKAIVLVTKGADHLDWTEQLSKAVGPCVSVFTYSDAISPRAEIELIPSSVMDETDAFLVSYSNAKGKIETATFSQKNICAAIGAQMRVVPRTESWHRTDVVVPLDSLQTLYNRIMFLTAMAFGCSVVCCGTEPGAIDLSSLPEIKPNILILSARDLLELTDQKLGFVSSIKLKRSLGLLAGGSLPSPIFDDLPGLRLVYTHEDQPPHAEKHIKKDKILSSSKLAHIRAVLGSRVVYALTYARVAGAVCQTHPMDYRDLGLVRVFGPVLPSVEAVVKDTDDLKGGNKQGHLFVRGPAVADEGWVPTNIVGEWGIDGCFREL
ncbi:uncharacterized protein V1516DRAFT_706795 [Lipomyces oligophaga]|uniref:uncharacterized protein n=1 Tax=Lipomyces oligophaga TaxID=45792 RepID=UPI0034CDD458